MGKGLGILSVGAIADHDQACFLLLEDFVEDTHHIAGSFYLAEVAHMGEYQLVRFRQHSTLAALGLAFFLFYIDEVRNYVDVFLYIEELIGHISEAL